MKKVVVGISGGVDSSVAAYLLKEQGYDITGVFMINWHDTTGTLHGDCPWNDDLIFAELVARKLEIPFHTVDFSEQYRKRVVEYMFTEYQNGRTPNPDVLCNREIKFDLFLEAADDLGADYIATGHYCTKETIQKDGKEIYRLLAGTDPSKEQSYFLCQLNQQQLGRALFPIGHLHKTEVRRIAKKLDLATADRKDSQGICFVGKVDLPVFLQQKLAPINGDVIEIDKNTYKFINNRPILGNDYETSELVQFTKKHDFLPEDGISIGHHKGAHFYTIGQRKGLNIGGKTEPLFVLGIDTQNNLVYVGQGHGHPGLNHFGLFIPYKDIHWIREDLAMKFGEYRNYLVRVRYRQPLQNAGLYMKNEGLYILFEEAQRGITPGQFAAFYDGEELIGSGVID